MSGGEYNNLGHHVYIRNEDGTYDEICTLSEIDTEKINENEENIIVRQEPLEIECSFLFDGKALEKFGIYLINNNWRKMHGLPMRRRHRK